MRADPKECSICQRNPHGFGLCSGDLCRAEKSAMDARRLKPVVAKRACAVGEREGHDNEITSLNRSNICADVFDHTYRFVPHHATSVDVFHFLIWPQIAPANACSGNANDSISRLDNFRVGHVLDSNVASAIHHSCAHNSCLKNLLSLRFQRSHVDREAVLHVRLRYILPTTVRAVTRARRGNRHGSHATPACRRRGAHTAP